MLGIFGFSNFVSCNANQIHEMEVHSLQICEVETEMSHAERKYVSEWGAGWSDFNKL